MSTNKTENYQLHKWEPGDDFLRQEFNENFAKIDETLGDKAQIVLGSYIGTATSPREIVLGFRPKAVLVESSSGSRSSGSYFSSGFVAEENLIDQGFQTVHNGNGSINGKDTRYFYWALR